MLKYTLYIRSLFFSFIEHRFVISRISIYIHISHTHTQIHMHTSTEIEITMPWRRRFALSTRAATVKIQCQCYDRWKKKERGLYLETAAVI